MFNLHIIYPLFVNYNFFLKLYSHPTFCFHCFYTEMKLLQRLFYLIHFQKNIFFALFNLIFTIILAFSQINFLFKIFVLITVDYFNFANSLCEEILLEEV